MEEELRESYAAREVELVRMEQEQRNGSHPISTYGEDGELELGLLRG